MIESPGFDVIHPLQTRDQWIQKWTNKCEKQSTVLRRLFEKSKDGFVTTCGHEIPLVNKIKKNCLIYKKIFQFLYCRFQD